MPVIVERFPQLDAKEIVTTRDALHRYARILGDILKASRPRRKHWWHASLRPSLRGLTTGIIRAAVDFEIELDLVGSRVRVCTPNDTAMVVLGGQSEQEIANWLGKSLTRLGVDITDTSVLIRENDERSERYRGDVAAAMHGALSSITASLSTLRAGVREETSPIQVWPHHFDLSMIWLPGPKIPGQDPADEEYADMQMNFGFAFGDDTFEEPYLYVTAYPLPDALPHLILPAPAKWQSDRFNGAVAFYKDVAAERDPEAWLQVFWSELLAGGTRHLL